MILIDMNMPQSCQGCPAFGTRACDKWDKHKTFSDQRTKRHSDCPLHESDVIEVLQGIRQEIEEKERRIELKNDPPDAWWVKWNVCLDECLEIIDKHIEQYKEDEG